MATTKNSKSFQVTVGFDNADFITKGTTNHSAKIQEAIDFVSSLYQTNPGYGGGTVFIKAGLYSINTPLTLKAGVSIKGDGMRKTYLKAQAGLNSDVIITQNFATESNSAVFGYSTCHSFELSDFTIDGNANNQTGSGSANFKLQLALAKLYGYRFKVCRIELVDAVENGFYTEYEQSQTQVFNQYELFEAAFYDIYIKTYRNIGWIMRGPHDSNINNCYVSTFETQPTFGRSHMYFETDSTKFFSYAGTVVNNLHTWGDLLHPYSSSCAFINDAAFVENGFFEGALIGYGLYIKNVSRAKFHWRTSYNRASMKIESTGTGQYLKSEQNDIKIVTVEQTPFAITNTVAANRPMKNWVASDAVTVGQWIYNPTLNLWYTVATAGNLDAAVLPTHVTGTVANGTATLAFAAYGVGPDHISMQGEGSFNNIVLNNTSKYQTQRANILDLTGYTRTQKNNNRFTVLDQSNLISVPIRGNFPAATDEIDFTLYDTTGNENGTRNVYLSKKTTVLARSRGYQAKPSMDTSTLTLVNYTNGRSFPDIQAFATTEFTQYEIDCKLRANTPATTTATQIKIDFRVGSVLLGTITNIPIPAGSVDRIVEVKAVIESPIISTVTPFCQFIIRATVRVSGDNTIYQFTRRMTNGSTAWAATTAVTLNQVVYSGNNYYVVTVAGTTGATAPVHVTGSAANGTATLQFIKTENAPLSVDLNTVKRIEPSVGWLSADTTNVAIIESIECTVKVNN